MKHGGNLPRCFSDAGDLAFISQIAEANPADAVISQVSVRSAADFAAVVFPGGELGLLLLL